MSDPLNDNLMLMHLCNLLEAWCYREDLPLRSADELAAEDFITPEQREWLNAYSKLWDASNI